MKIARVLNNNCVIALDDNHKEMVLYGNGIGFKKRANQLVDKSKIDKVFVLQSEQLVTRFSELLDQIPEEIILLSEDLIEEGREQLQMKLDESIHLSLPDHISTAVNNAKDGIHLHNTMLLEIKKFYQAEFALGMMGLQMTQERLGVSLTEDEAGFIAMHFVNAQSSSDSNNTKAIIKLLEEIDYIISRTFSKKFAEMDKSSLVYCRYMTHLKFFAQRVFTKTYFPENDIHILAEPIKQYRAEYACSRRVCEFVEKKYHYKVCEDEVIYLTVHLAQIMSQGREEA